jgi:hypothetical protein
MITFTSEVDPLRMSVRVVAEGEALTGLVIWRRTPVGTPTRARLLEMVSTETRFEGIDWETPLDLPVTYWATTETESSDPVTVTVSSGGLDWLKSVAMPALSRPIEVRSFDELTRALSHETLRPLGRAAPVVMIDTRQTCTGELVVLTRTDDDRRAMRTFLRESPVALLQGPQFHGWDEGLYCVLTDYTEARVAGSDGANPARLFSISVVEVDRPSTGVGFRGGWTWQDHLDAGHTWADWRDLTWLEVLFGVDGQLPSRTRGGLL